MRLIVVILSLLLVESAATAQLWQSIAPMPTPRRNAQAVVLNDGRILLIGGRNETEALGECEIYDPTVNTWSRTGSLKIPRFDFIAHTLPDGRVLAAGGLIDVGTTTTASCELFDIATGQWSALPAMSEPREKLRSVELPDRSILLVGGLNANPPITYLKSIDRFDPQTLTMSSFPSMLIGLYAHDVYYNADKNAVVVAGGQFYGTNGYYLRSSQIFLFSEGRWKLTDSLSEPHSFNQGASPVMSDGSPLMVSGRSGQFTIAPSVERLDLNSLTWEVVGTLNTPTVAGHIYSFGGDSVLVAGGLLDMQGQIPLAATSWFSYATRSSTPGPTMLTARRNATGVRLAVPTERPCEVLQSACIFGGRSETTTIAACEKYVVGRTSVGTSFSVSPDFLATNLLTDCGSLDTVIVLTFSGCAASVGDPPQLTLMDLLDNQDLGLATDLSLPSRFIADPSNPGSWILRVPISLTGRSHSGTRLRFLIDCSAGSITRYATIGASGKGGVQMAIPSAVSLTGSICEASSIELPLANVSCQEIELVRAEFTSGDKTVFRVLTPLPLRFAPEATANLILQASAQTAGTFTSTLRMTYRMTSTAQVLDTSIDVTAVLSGKAVIDAGVYINDAEAEAGAVFRLPVRLYGTNGERVRGFRLRLEYNTDLITMIEPEMSGSCAEGLGADVNKSESGASVLVPEDLPLTSGMPLITLRFKTFLTKEQCSPLRIRSLEFSPSDPTAAGCILSDRIDSALVCVLQQCGDRTLRSALHSYAQLKPRIELDGEHLRIAAAGMEVGSCTLTDLFGRTHELLRHADVDGFARWSLNGYPSGFYLASIVTDGRRTTRPVFFAR